jgi:hypothetical protein
MLNGQVAFPAQGIRLRMSVTPNNVTAFIGLEFPW